MSLFTRFVYNPPERGMSGMCVTWNDFSRRIQNGLDLIEWLYVFSSQLRGLSFHPRVRPVEDLPPFPPKHSSMTSVWNGTGINRHSFQNNKLSAVHSYRVRSRRHSIYDRLYINTMPSERCWSWGYTNEKHAVPIYTCTSKVYTPYK